MDGRARTSLEATLAPGNHGYSVRFLRVMRGHRGNQEYIIEIQTGVMKRRPGNRIEGATGCPSWCRPLRPLFHFLDDVSYPQSVHCTIVLCNDKGLPKGHLERRPSRKVARKLGLPGGKFKSLTVTGPYPSYSWKGVKGKYFYL